MRFQLNRLNAVSILTRVAGLGVLASDATFQTSITALAGPHGPKIVAGIGLASFLATDVLNAMQHSKTPSAAVVDAASAVATILPKTTQVATAVAEAAVVSEAVTETQNHVVGQ